MARIRTVKPELFGSYTMAQLPIEARYMAIGLLTEADDHGRLIDSPKRIAGSVFPHDEKVTAAKVDKWLNDLASVGTITRYEIAGGRYIEFPKWDSHQKVTHKGKSRLPTSSGEFPEDYQQGSGDAPI